MATTKKEIKKVVEDRLITTNDELDKLKVGSEEHSRAVKDMTLLATSLAELDKVRIQQEDNEAKREEQQRMNDKEIEFKETQLAIDAARAENDKANKAQQLKKDIAAICLEGATRGFAMIGYSALAGRAYRAEYYVSDGTSKQLPNHVQRPLDNLLTQIGRK